MHLTKYKYNNKPDITPSYHLTLTENYNDHKDIRNPVQHIGMCLLSTAESPIKTEIS